MLIYTFRFFKTKQMRFSSLVYDENKASFRRTDAKIGENKLRKFQKILPKAIEKIEP